MQVLFATKGFLFVYLVPNVCVESWWYWCVDYHPLLQPDNINQNIVPKVGMQFRSIEDAYGFFARYAGVMGSGIKRYREKHGSKWLSCGVYGDDKRVFYVVIDLANLHHNHDFLPSPSAGKNFHCLIIVWWTWWLKCMMGQRMCLTQRDLTNMWVIRSKIQVSVCYACC